MTKHMSAFPVIAENGLGHVSDGMSLRDWFAGQALAGIMANPVRWEQIAADYTSGKKSYDQCSAANATKAYSIADAMLCARASQAEGGAGS
jgi:hypothetical protein